MKVYPYFITAIALALTARANVYVPNAKLAGETVQVRLAKETAYVSAAFEFEEWQTRDKKIVYFPMFANDVDDPVGVLARSGFELEIRGKKSGIATPCEAPEKFKKLPNNPRICWFVVSIDDLIKDAEVDYSGHLAIKVSYNQPLIHGQFFYLPVIAGWTASYRDERSWRYQLHAHAGTRVTQVLSSGSDYEQLSDGVVVYLRDGEIVELQ